MAMYYDGRQWYSRDIYCSSGPSIANTEKQYVSLLGTIIISNCGPYQQHGVSFIPLEPIVAYWYEDK